MKRLPTVALLVLAITGCSGSGGAGPADCGDAGCLADVPFRTTLPGLAEFESVAARGREVKYLAPAKDALDPRPLVEACYFQNMARFPWHLDFLHSFDETASLTMAEYSARVLRHESRVWWGGSLRRWPATPHPVSKLPGLVTFELYNEDIVGNPVPVGGIIELAATLSGCAGFAADRLAFLPLGTSQTQVATFYRDALASKGVTVVLPEDIVEAGRIDVLTPGEGYGYLKLVPDGQPLVDYGPRDVVVVRSAPSDISIVAGLVTADPQNLFSHVNLRLGEKGIPNASVPDVYTWPELPAMQGTLVRIVAREGDVAIEPATLDAASAFWASVRPSPGTIVSDFSASDLRGFESLRAADAPAFGAKAANLGELHGLLEPGARVEGFGIPVVHYRDFAVARGVKDEVDAMLAAPATFTDAAARRAALKSIRNRIRSAPLLPDFETALRARILEVYGPQAASLRVRFRSSSNAEDLVAWSGAGLYDSRSGCLADDLDGDATGPSGCLGAPERAFLEARLADSRARKAGCEDCAWLDEIIDEIEEDLSEEKTVADAVRKVWASLWNDRAFEEREYWGIDHRDVYMGIAVNPTFVQETRDAVAVTGLPGQDGSTTYRILSVVAPESVARPEDPTVVPEVLTFRRVPGDPLPLDATVVVPGSQSDGGTSLWTDAEVRELAGLLHAVHDHFSGLPWTGDAPSSFEVEVKKDAAGRIVLKQARPYLLGF